MKQVLLIGLEPTHLNYDLFPDLNSDKVLAGLKSEVEEGKKLGYEIELCLINPDGSDVNVILDRLQKKQFDCILIGAGVRTIPEYFLLFEKAINLVHQNAPRSKICFNTNPTDSIKAVSRWI